MFVVWHTALVVFFICIAFGLGIVLGHSTRGYRLQSLFSKNLNKLTTYLRRKK